MAGKLSCLLYLRLFRKTRCSELPFLHVWFLILPLCIWLPFPDRTCKSCADMVLPTVGFIGYSEALWISAQSPDSQIRDCDWCSLDWVLSSVQSCGLEGGTLAVEFPSSEAGNVWLDPE